MQFEPDFRFDMDDSFSICSQPMSIPSTRTSFSSASSSAYEPFTPTSRRSTPNQLSLDFDGAYALFSGAHHGELASPSGHGHMSRYMFGGSVKVDPEPLSFSEVVSPTSMRKTDGVPAPDYEHMLEMNMASRQSTGSITPSGNFPMYTISPTTMGPASFMMTPTHSLSGSEVAESSSSWCSNESPISFFPQKCLGSIDMERLEMDRQSPSPLETHHLHCPPSPGHLRAQRKMMVHEIQRRTTELHRVQSREIRNVGGGRTDSTGLGKPDGTGVDVVRRAMCKCDYPGCHKAFRRNEHLKRHKQTFHGEGPNRFSCEFCGKDQFNRQDNLNNHRKLHARPNSRNRGVEFIPASVPVIEQEERSRKRRAPPKSKTADKRGGQY
ncbi:hypothetical protein E4U41_006708 [Claviceps citrina]|nr:hypothetical protein E4U41_006708 [Claviceps citrina]